MTAVCGGGTSAPKTGAAAVVDYTAGLLGAIFAAYDTKWLIPVIPLVGLAPLTLSTFCGSDPPTVPTFTQAEVDALLQVTLGSADFDSGLSKAKDWILNAIWYDVCQCTSGTLAPLTPPAQPANSITTVYPSGTPVPQSCRTQVTVGNMGVAPGTYTAADSNYYTTAQTELQTRIQINVTSATTGSHTLPSWKVQWFNHNTVATAFVPLGNAPQIDVTLDIPAAFDQIFIVMTNTVNDAGVTYTITLTDYCGGTLTGQQTQPCCPPDPATATLLNSILDVVRSMQRNYAPLGYVKGTTHAALSGTGSIAVSRLIGVEVQITTYPNGNAVLPGNPNYVKDLGWMSVSEADGMIQELRVARLQFTWFPQLMPLADHINYDLFPGVVATFTELAPEA